MHCYRSALYLTFHSNPKIMCVLSCASLISEKYTSINKVFTPTLISMIVYNRTRTLSLRYGTHNYFSLQLRDIKVETIIKK